MSGPYTETYLWESFQMSLLSLRALRESKHGKLNVGGVPFITKTKKCCVTVQFLKREKGDTRISTELHMTPC